MIARRPQQEADHGGDLLGLDHPLDSMRRADHVLEDAFLGLAHISSASPTSMPGGRAAPWTSFDLRFLHLRRLRVGTRSAYGTEVRANSFGEGGQRGRHNSAVRGTAFTRQSGFVLEWG